MRIEIKATILAAKVDLHVGSAGLSCQAAAPQFSQPVFRQGDKREEGER
jgi:hypothetical protein